MNEEDRRIGVLAPVNAALEWTKQVLFRPFDLEKWLIIGFAAFLSHLVGGGGGNFNFGLRNLGRGDWRFHTSSYNYGPPHIGHHSPALWLILGGVGLLVGLAVMLVLLWIGCRGRFIFLDCIARNRAAIREPWREFQAEGNSLFRLTLVAMLVFFLVILAAAVPFIISFVFHRGTSNMEHPVTVLALALMVSVVVVLAVAWVVVVQVVVVAMYCRRCRAFAGLRMALGLMSREPLPFVLYVLFLLFLSIATALISCLAMCVTCCLAAIPYLGTVILLPLYVFLTTYSLTFLRQFGPEWNVWARVQEASPTPPVTPSPPVQQDEPPSVEPSSVPPEPGPETPPPLPRSSYEPPEAPPPV